MEDRRFRVIVALLGAIAVLLAGILAVLATRGGSEEATGGAPPSAGGSTIVSTAPVTSTTGATTPPPDSPPTSPAPTTPTSTTATSTTSSTTTTATTTTTTIPPLELGPAGIGGVAFGADPEVAIAYASGVLGPPSRDSGWIDAFSEYGTCPPPVVRGVEWAGSGDWFGFVLLFTRAPTSFRPGGGDHLFAYYYLDGTSPAGLGTPEGIFIGSTLAEAAAAYPELRVVDDEILGPVWTVDVDPADDALLSGSATGVGPDGLIETIDGGVGCGE